MNNLKFIYNQKYDPTANLKLGIKNSSFNGCGWIASYNALLLLNYKVTTSEVINYFKKHGLILFGLLGISPFAIANYFKKLHFNVTKTLFPKNNIDHLVKNFDTSILFFMHSHGCHFITITYNQSEKLFNAYNIFSNSNGVDKFPSLDKLLSDYSFRPLMLINIKNNG